MDENPVVGYRFHPTDEELVNHYLKNKILGESSLVDEAISEININDYDPASLRSLAKIQSNDPTYYFFARARFMSSRSNLRKRCTKSGFWKPTGKDREIKEKNGKKIGLKKTLVYYERVASKTVMKKTKKKNPWVMHEYHIKDLVHPDSESYVICKIKYKGEDDEGDIIIPSIGETSQSMASNSIITTPLEVDQPVEEEENGLSLDDLDFAMPIMNQPQVEEINQNTIFDGLFENDLAMQRQDEEAFDSNSFFDGLFENDLEIPMKEPQEVIWDPNDPNTWFNDLEEFVMQEDCNDYKPRKPLAGIIVGYDSDIEEAESISVTSYQGTLSPGDSVGSSSNEHFPSCRDETLSSSIDTVQTSSVDSLISRENAESQKLTRRIIPLNQEVNEDTSRIVDAKTEKKSLFVTEDAIVKTHKKTPKYVYLMTMIIGLIILVALIGNIVSVLSTVKTG